MSFDHRPDIQPAVGWETGRISSAARGAGPGRRAWAMGISGPWVGTGLENVINHELSQL